MPENVAHRYDKIYTENETPFGSGNAERIVQDLLKYCTGGSALELGAGQGRNTLFLAAHGFSVKAVDISEVGIQKLQQALKDRGLEAETVVADVRGFQINNDYDVLLSTFVLHHLAREEALSLISTMQERTSAGGLNAIAVFTKNGDFYTKEQGMDKFYPEEGETKKLYEGWDILEYEETETKAFAKKSDGSPMVNVTARILAKKPGKEF
jgi:tellurite methyltransferase